MSKSDFGIFKEFWNGYPNHLPLLGLNLSDNDNVDFNLEKSIRRLHYINNKYSREEILEGISKLLKIENWRTHLVALIASFILKEEDQSIFIPDFWNRLKKGSWISPQILSTLSIIDKDFEIKANQMLRGGFEVTFSEMGMLEHHSARGPEGNKEASEKVIESIKSLLSINDDEFLWKSRLMELIEIGKIKRNNG